MPAEQTEPSNDRPHRDAPGPGHDALMPLVHSDVHVPHRRFRVASLNQLPTSDGVAFTAEVRLDTTPVGVIENDGHGGATTYVAVNSSPFNWRHLGRFVAQCRRSAEPVDEETVLNALVEEFDLGREAARATRAGLTLIRLMSPQGWCLTIRTTAAVNTTRLTDLAAHLINDPAATPGAVWQIWTSGGWRHVVTVPSPPAARPSTVEQEPPA
jgi:hypothetical protein